MNSSLSDGTFGRAAGTVAAEPSALRACPEQNLLRVLHRSLDFRQRPEDILSQAAEEFRALAKASSVVVYTPCQGELVPLAPTSSSPVAAAPRNGLVWWTARARQPVSLDEYGGEGQATADPTIAQGQPLLLLPVATAGSLYGVVQLQREGPPFAAAEAESAGRLAALLARACDAAGLYRRQQEYSAHLERLLAENRRLQEETQAQAARLRESFRQMGVALSAGVSLEETLQAIVDIACRIIQAKSGLLRLREGDLLVTKAIRGDEKVQRLRDFHFQVGEGVVGEVVAYGRPVIVNRFEEVDYPFREQVEAAGIQSLLSVPIFSADGRYAIGSLTVHNKEKGQDFTLEDQHALMAFAAHASGSVEKAAIRDKEREAAAAVQVLYEIAAAASSLDLHEVLRVACTKMIEVAEVDRCAIFLVDPGKTELRCVEAQGINPRLLKAPGSLRLRYDQIGDRAWQRLMWGNPVPIAEAGSSVLVRRLTEALEAQEGLLVPLNARGRLIGALYLEDSKGKRTPQEYQCRLVGGISRQVAVAIDNARLYAQNDQRVRELTALNRVSAAASHTLVLPDLLNKTLRETVDVFQAGSGSIMLLDPETQQLRVAASIGLPERLGKRAIRDLGEGVAGFVAARREPLLTDNLRSDPRFRNLMSRPEIHSAMVAPIMSGGKVLGVLNVSAGREHRPFTSDDLSLLTTICGQLAVAIENARHFDSERQVAQIARESIMPRLPLRVKGLDIGEKHIPANDVGGDYYDVFPLGEGRVGILVSDVSGKSVTAAMHGAMSKFFIRALAHVYESPADLLREVNKLIVQDTPTEIFVSAFYGVLDIEAKRLVYANAGHCPPIVVDFQGNITELSGTGMLLGLWPDSTYDQVAQQLQPNDLLLCYTDGITEARRQGKLFGDQRLQACAARNRHRPAQAIADTIYRRTLTYCGRRVDDDIAILVMKLEE